MGLGIEVAIVLALIALNGALAMAELALVSSRRVRLQQAADRGDAGARAALDLAAEPTRFLSTVQVGITLVGILAGAFGGASVAHRFDGWLRDAGLSVRLARAVSFAGVVTAITYLSLVFGELVPKRIALHSPERFASIVARPMIALSQAAAPVVAVLAGSTSVVLRLLGLHRPPAVDVTEEEIRLQIAMSAQTGTVAPAEAQLLERVFFFGDRRVHEVMVPRTEVVWLSRDDTVRDFYAVFSSHPHSRFPVYDGGPDTVVGVLVVKELLRRIASGEMSEDSPVSQAMRPAHFVPETKLVGELFRELQARRLQMAIAVDEFGGTAGIVTLEQLLEEIVGSVADELRPAEAEVIPIDESTSEVDGALSIEEARAILGIDIPEGDYDTIAGYVLSELGRIPSEGDAVAVDGWRIVVIGMKGQKVELLRVTRTA